VHRVSRNSKASCALDYTVGYQGYEDSSSSTSFDTILIHNLYSRNTLTRILRVTQNA